MGGTKEQRNKGIQVGSPRGGKKRQTHFGGNKGTHMQLLLWWLGLVVSGIKLPKFWRANRNYVPASKVSFLRGFGGKEEKKTGTHTNKHTQMDKSASKTGSGSLNVAHTRPDQSFWERLNARSLVSSFWGMLFHSFPHFLWPRTKIPPTSCFPHGPSPKSEFRNSASESPPFRSSQLFNDPGEKKRGPFSRETIF